jgi:hypothetical protein
MARPSANGGDGTVAADTNIRTGFAYKYTKEQTYGGTNLLFAEKDSDLEDSDPTWVHGTKQRGIWIAS